MLRNFIDSVEKLESLLKKTLTIPNAESAKIAIVRPTTHFKIETPDNPDMVHTLELQEDYVKEQFAKLTDLTLTEEQKQNLTRKFKDEFQHHLSLDALEKQKALIEILKNNDITTIPLLEDKTTACDLYLMSKQNDGIYKESDKNHLYLYRDIWNIFYFTKGNEKDAALAPQYLDIKALREVDDSEFTNSSQSPQDELIKYDNETMIEEVLKTTTKRGHTDFNYFTDQIFATDTGQYYYDNDIEELCFMPAHFKNTQRKREERLAITQAENLGAKIKKLEDEKGNQLIFEGGDIRQMPGKKLFFIGQGLRSDSKTAEAIAMMTGYIVLPIVLLKKQFYHLDCCFLPLPNDAAMIYEGEYSLDENNQPKIDSNGLPEIIPGTETMDLKSRALIRYIYPPNKLITITEEEALAFATNAAILEDKNGRFKMFVNGEPDRQLNTITNAEEQQKLRTQTISLLKRNIGLIQAATENKMDIIETPFNTMHGSGGSVRCTIQEVPCSQKTLDLYLGDNKFGSQAIDRIEKTRKIPKTDLFFAHKKPLPLSKEEPNIKATFKLK